MNLNVKSKTPRIKFVLVDKSNFRRKNRLFKEGFSNGVREIDTSNLPNIKVMK